jgi:hypothetical protein
MGRDWARSLGKVVAEKDLCTGVSGQSSFHYIICLQHWK